MGHRFILVLVSIFVSTAVCSAADWGTAIRTVDKLVTPNQKKETRKSREPARPAEEEQAPAGSSDDDRHYIFPDDYFIQNKGLGNSAWIYVKLAKLVTPPNRQTKDEGEFMEIYKGTNIWTKHYWQTRLADQSELKLGMHVIAFNDHNQGGVYKAPQKKDKARGGRWFYAKITDMSDTYKGYVTLSGNYKVDLDNLRVILPRDAENAEPAVKP